eukprot:396643_1
MSLFLSLLAILLHQNSASNTVRRLSESDDDWYCVTGPSGQWGKWHGQNAIKGNYQYGGKDNNNNDYWFISLEDGSNCVFGVVSWKELYLRQSTHNNRYEIATAPYENWYITRCEDDAKTPDTCESWSSENFESVSWVSEHFLFIQKGKCPDVYTEAYLTASESTYGCNGEFTKHASRNNVYIRNELFVNSNWGDHEYPYAWYFNYPSQEWTCTNGYTMDYLVAYYTTNDCHAVTSSGPKPSATLSFHD